MIDDEGPRRTTLPGGTAGPRSHPLSGRVRLALIGSLLVLALGGLGAWLSRPAPVEQGAG